MLELPHTLVGAAIATAIPNPAISLPLSLASHFVTEYIPHWNPHLYTEVKTYSRISRRSLAIVITDSALALSLGTWVALRSPQPLIILAACLLAVLPDVIEIPFFFFKSRLGWIAKLVHWQRAHQWNVQPVWGIVSQLVVVGLSLSIIF